MRSRWIFAAGLALLVLTALPPHAVGAPRAKTPVISYSISAVAARISGVVCRTGRNCVAAGCVAATASPKTSDELTPMDGRTECRVDVSIMVTGKATSGGKPLKGQFILAQSQNKDTDHCWPDTSVASLVACSTQRLRPLTGGGGTIDSRGRFTLKLTPDTYAAAGFPAVDQLKTCKTYPAQVTLKVGKTKLVRQVTPTACA